MLCPKCKEPLTIPPGIHDGELQCPKCLHKIARLDPDATLDADLGESPVAGPRHSADEPGKRPVRVVPAGNRPGPTDGPASDVDSWPGQTDDDDPDDAPEPDEEAHGWLGSVLQDRYKVIRFIARGGMGLVFLGTDKKTERFVAIKVLARDLQNDPKFLKRFELEAKALAGFKHRSIVDLLDSDRDSQGRCYLVMPYVEGPAELFKREARSPRPAVTLAEAALAKTGPDGRGMDFESLREIVCDILSALEHARSRKPDFVHRDIKLGNILVDESWHAQLVDFGIARGAVQTPGEPTLTSPGSLVGTLAYMAPELHADSANASPRSDIYAVGVVLYRCLTGLPAGDLSEPVQNFRPDLNPAIEDIVRRALAPNPEHRYQSPEEMRLALEEYAPQQEEPDRPRPWKPILLTLAAAAVWVLAITVFHEYNTDRSWELMHAIDLGDATKVHQLLQAEPGWVNLVDVRYLAHGGTNQSTGTPLHCAASRVPPVAAVVEELVALNPPGGGIDVQDSKGNSPLNLLVQEYHIPERLRTAKLLLERSADPDLRNATGKSAFDRAIEMRLTALVKLLGMAKITRDLRDPANIGPKATNIQNRIAETIQKMKTAPFVSYAFFLDPTDDPDVGKLIDAFSFSEQESVARALFKLKLDDWRPVFFDANSHGLTPIQQAVKNSNFPVATVFVENLKAKLPDKTDQDRVLDANYQNPADQTPNLPLACVAIANNQARLLKILIVDLGVGTNTVCKGKSLLELGQASSSQDIRAVITLPPQANSPPAAKSEEVKQEIRDNLLFQGFLSNRVEVVLGGVVPEGFTTQRLRREKSATVLISDGVTTSALVHVNESPYRLGSPSDGVREQTVDVVVRGAPLLSGPAAFLRADPRGLVVRVDPASAQKAGVRVYQLAKNPFKFTEALLLSRGGRYFGEVEFRRGDKPPGYVRISSRSGKFTPLSGDLVVSRSGEILGLMVNSKYCVVLSDVQPAAGGTLDPALTSEAVAKKLGEFSRIVDRLPREVQ